MSDRIQTQLSGMAKTIDTIRLKIDELRPQHVPAYKEWDVALKSLDEARISFARLSRMNYDNRLTPTTDRPTEQGS